MAHEELLKQLAMERQKRGISKESNVRQLRPQSAISNTSEHRYAWEYEVEAYRKQLRRQKWYALGTFCGIASLILEFIFHWVQIVQWVKTFIPI